MNVMLSKGAGGIQQSFVDYGAGLTARGHDTLAVIHPRAAITAKAASAHGSCLPLPNRGRWDLLAAWRLRRMLDRHQPAVILAHGGRALAFALRAAARRIPVVAVSHNYRFQDLARADAVFAITAHMKQAIEADAGVEGHRIVVVPNSIAIGTKPDRAEWQSPPVIGALGRMVPKKGFDVLIDALALLHERGRPFRARIAGDGPVAPALRRQAEERGLAGLVSFPGWIVDAPAFLRSNDVFCLPSRHEPFGIVALEAMAEGLPIVSTATEGPAEILTDRHDALLCPAGDAARLADALAETLDDAAAARARGVRAAETVRSRFDRRIVMAGADQALVDIVTRGPGPVRRRPGGLLGRLFG